MNKTITPRGKRRRLLILALFCLLLAQAIVIILICGYYLENARGLFFSGWDDKSRGRHDDIEEGYGPIIALFSGTAAFMSMVALFLLACGLIRQDEEIREQKEQNAKDNRNSKIKMLIDMSSEFHSREFMFRYENAKTLLDYLRPDLGYEAALDHALVPASEERTQRANDVFLAICKWMSQGIVSEAVDKISLLIHVDGDVRASPGNSSGARRERALELFTDFVHCMNFVASYSAVLLSEDPPIQEIDFFESHWEAIRPPVMHLLNESVKNLSHNCYNFYQSNLMNIDEYYSVNSEPSN